MFEIIFFLANVKIANANIDFDYVNWSNSTAEIKLENVARVEIPKNESIINKVVNKTSDDAHSAHDQEKGIGVIQDKFL